MHPRRRPRAPFAFSASGNALQRDARQVIRDAIAPVTQKAGPAVADSYATLILAVLNGLSVTEYLEGDELKAKEAYEAFLGLLQTALEAPSNGS